MRKLTIFLAAVIFVLSLAACKSTGINTGSANMVTEATLTDREKLFLSVGSNKHFVFDYKTDGKYKWLKVWVDCYEHGRKAFESGALIADLSAGKDGTIIAAVRDNGAEANDWILAIDSGGSFSKAESKNVYDTGEETPYASTMSYNKSKMNIKDKELVLAGACYQVAGEGGTTLAYLEQGGNIL